MTTDMNKWSIKLNRLKRKLEEINEQIKKLSKEKQTVIRKIEEHFLKA